MVLMELSPEMQLKLALLRFGIKNNPTLGEESSNEESNSQQDIGGTDK